jgi:hypothetical protein
MEITYFARRTKKPHSDEVKGPSLFDGGNLCISFNRKSDEDLMDCLEIDPQVGDLFHVTAKVCFRSRKKTENKRKTQFLGEDDMTDLFLRKAGLEKRRFPCAFKALPKDFIRSHDVFLGNILFVQGVLAVKDVDLFSKALSLGVGSHHSYGYGLLLVEPHSFD